VTRLELESALAFALASGQRSGDRSGRPGDQRADRRPPATTIAPVATGRGLTGGRIRLGVLATHAIQYQAPLYRELARRGRVRLEVAFLTDAGASTYLDPGFGRPVRWDIDVLSGYQHTTLRAGGSPATDPAALGRLARWIRRQDAVVVHGYSSPWMVAAIGLARAAGRPYLLRCESWPRGGQPRWRVARDGLVRSVVRHCAAGLTIGVHNDDFYASFGAPRQVFAPYSVDNERFRAGAVAGRTDRPAQLRALGLPDDRPVVLFAAKLIARKRPVDLIDAVRRLDGRVSLLMVGDGPLLEEVRARTAGLPAACVGFVNQTDLPRYYGLADILALPSEHETWGLVVNEAMAAGALPVVSDAVGAGPDLVDGLGQVFGVGDVAGLTDCLTAAARDLGERGLAARIRTRVDRYSLAATAAGFEQAAVLATGRVDPGWPEPVERP
jgi:glycosyltransferase involved in cell wall biosynthesis